MRNSSFARAGVTFAFGMLVCASAAQAASLVSVVDGSFDYDGTYDPYTSYFGGTDADTGRPVEVYGIGYRNGNSTVGTNLETVSFAPAGPPSSNVRNAYATEALAGGTRDVSNNVLDAFDPTPFAVGTTALAAGATVPAGTVYTGRRHPRPLALCSRAMAELPSRDPLHGVTLEKMLNELVEHFGWPELGQQIAIRCFNSDPSVPSSLKFLRKTPWAREKVESLYGFMLRERKRAARSSVPS